MKPYNLLFLLALELCLTPGCVTMTTHDSVKRAPTTQIDLFREGSAPSRPYKEIGTLEKQGESGQQSAIEKNFVAKAKALGGNGLILHRSPSGGESCRFRATIIVYE